MQQDKNTPLTPEQFAQKYRGAIPDAGGNNRSPWKTWAELEQAMVADIHEIVIDNLRKAMAINAGTPDGNATLAVLAEKGTLWVYPLNKPLKAGDAVDVKNDIDKGALPIAITFATPKSVDTFINALQTIKSNWRTFFEPSKAC